jgi:hypothetical protein
MRISQDVYADCLKSILKEGLIYKDYIYWSTESDDLINPITSDIKLDIYGGNSGILYVLFNEYANNLSNQNLVNLGIIEKSFNYILFKYQYNNKTTHLSDGFLSGNIGTLLVLQIVNDYCDFNEKGRLDELLFALLKRLNEGCSSFSNEYLYGRSGVIFGLLFLYEINESNRSNCLKVIKRFLNFLISDIRKADIGVFADWDPMNVMPLTGFSHGTSGLIYLFKYLSGLIDNPKLNEMINDLEAYELSLYDASKANYYDNRPIDYKDRLSLTLGGFSIQKISDRQPFLAWCHGIIGMGCNKACDKSYDYFHEIILKTITRDNQHFGLCHGILGNLICLYSHNNLNPYHDLYEKGDGPALDKFLKIELEQRENKENSLMIGKSGVLFYYQLYNVNCINFLYPKPMFPPEFVESLKHSFSYYRPEYLYLKDSYFSKKFVANFNKVVFSDIRKGKLSFNYLYKKSCLINSHAELDSLNMKLHGAYFYEEQGFKIFNIYFERVDIISVDRDVFYTLRNLYFSDKQLTTEERALLIDYYLYF